jgi:hypothetical protein
LTPSPVSRRRRPVERQVQLILRLLRLAAGESGSMVIHDRVKSQGWARYFA